MSEPKHIYNLKLNSPYKLWRRVRMILLATPNQKVDLPPSYNIPIPFTPYDQGNIGSCTANSVCASIRIHAKNIVDPSRLFLYYQAREKENSLDKEGAYIDDVYNTLKELGVCNESTWPYIIGNENIKPNSQAYTEAKNIRTSSWGNVSPLPSIVDGIKQTIYNNKPVVLGIRVYQSFESDDVAKTGIVPVPDTGKEKLYGGHAIIAVGFDDSKGALLLMNSWGPHWGTNHPTTTTKGFCYLPYAFVNDPHLCDEAVFMADVIVNGVVRTPPTTPRAVQEIKSVEPVIEVKNEPVIVEPSKEIKNEPTISQRYQHAPITRNIDDPPIAQRYQPQENKNGPVVSQRYK